jgi:hypothetical protein
LHFDPSQLRGGILHTPTKQKMKMILNDKQSCIDSIAKVLERTAAWRKAIAVNFPDDPRNMRAAETLEKLAIEANNLSDEHWSDLKPTFQRGWASEKWRNGLSQAARSVGFHHRAKDFNFFAKVLVQQLSPSSVA